MYEKLKIRVVAESRHHYGYKGFFVLFSGEQPEGCTSNETIWRATGGVDRCPEQNALVPLLAAVYLILTNILLVNLLIAMFR